MIRAGLGEIHHAVEGMSWGHGDWGARDFCSRERSGIPLPELRGAFVAVYTEVPSLPYLHPTCVPSSEQCLQHGQKFIQLLSFLKAGSRLV